MIHLRCTQSAEDNEEEVADDKEKKDSPYDRRRSMTSAMRYIADDMSR